MRGEGDGFIQDSVAFRDIGPGDSAERTFRFYGDCTCVAEGRFASGDCLSAYGTYLTSGMIGVCIDIVIDKNGNVAFAEVLPAPGDFPNFDGIKKALEAIK